MATETLSAIGWVTLPKAPGHVGPDGLGTVEFDIAHGATPFVGTLKAQRKPTGAPDSAYKDIPGAEWTAPANQILYLKPYSDIRVGFTAYTSGQGVVSVN